MRAIALAIVLAGIGLEQVYRRAHKLEGYPLTGAGLIQALFDGACIVGFIVCVIGGW